MSTNDQELHIARNMKQTQREHEENPYPPLRMFAQFDLLTTKGYPELVPDKKLPASKSVPPKMSLTTTLQDDLHQLQEDDQLVPLVPDELVMECHGNIRKGNLILYGDSIPEEVEGCLRDDFDDDYKVGGGGQEETNFTGRGGALRRRRERWLYGGERGTLLWFLVRGRAGVFCCVGQVRFC